MMRTITSRQLGTQKYHGTTDLCDYRCGPFFSSFPRLSFQLTHSLSLSVVDMQKIFLRLSSTRRDDRLDVFQQTIQRYHNDYAMRL